MGDSIRKQIVAAIAARLALIAPNKVFTLSDGSSYTCTSTITGGVHVWRRTPLAPTAVPAILVKDMDAETSPGPTGHHNHDLQCTAVALMAGTSPITTVRAVAQDIVAAIGSDPRWGGLARWTDITGHLIDVEQQGDEIAAVQISFTVNYRTTLFRI